MRYLCTQVICCREMAENWPTYLAAANRFSDNVLFLPVNVCSYLFGNYCRYVFHTLPSFINDSIKIITCPTHYLKMFCMGKCPWTLVVSVRKWFVITGLWFIISGFDWPENISILFRHQYLIYSIPKHHIEAYQYDAKQ